MGISELEIYSQIKIRSKRQRKRAALEDQEKKLIRLYKEDKELMLRKSKLPMIDLVPPIQRGWKRYFIVREDVRRSRDGVFYENLLQKINTVQYSSEKVFRKKKKRNGKRINVEIKQDLRIVYPYELPKMKLSERELACFDYCIIHEVNGRKINEKYAYIFREPWRYILRVRPNMIDKVQVQDIEIEQRLGELKSILFDNYENFGTLKKLRGWGNFRWDNKLKYENLIKNKPLYRILEEEKTKSTQK